LKIRFDNFRTITRGITIQYYSASEDVVRRAVFACLKRIDLNRKVRPIGIMVTNLEKVEKVSLPV
ncbi:MAG: hypothetical protein WCO89_12670, partial [Syntrophus sp. (in: bacteria)]